MQFAHRLFQVDIFHTMFKTGVAKTQLVKGLSEIETQSRQCNYYDKFLHSIADLRSSFLL